jgi:hypothetical protein
MIQIGNWIANFPLGCIKIRGSIKRAILFVAYLQFFYLASAQEADSLKFIDHFSGKVTITNNGISFIPSFSLGKPAIIFNMDVGRKKLSFEPEMRFALEGKPWSFLFWWRYKAIEAGKFSLRIGAHPALNFRTINVVTNGVTREVMETRRYAAAELVPNYNLTDNIAVGMYYLHGYGFDEGVKNTDFLVLNSVFSNIGISNQLAMKIVPQFYYLKVDNEDGFYFAVSASLEKSGFPISLGALMNQNIKTDIVSDKGFVWNISLVYSF